MKIGLDNNEIKDNDAAHSDGLADMIREQSEKEKTKLSDLKGKAKAAYIWDYYKWWFIGGIIVIVLAVTFIRDWRENSKPVFLYAEMLNTYFAYDKSNTISDDFVRAENIDLDKEQLVIGTDTYLSDENFDNTMIAFQQRLIASYAAQSIDVVIGPKKILEGPANCDAYANFEEILPKELLEELKDRDYELYYFDPAADEIDDTGYDPTPYCAGIYLDNCTYLNNMGENGAYPVAETEGDRIIFTIAANSLRVDHAIDFLKFLTE